MNRYFVEILQWWRVFIRQLLGLTVRPCMLEPEEIDPTNLKCDNYCTHPVYKEAGNVQQGVVNGKLWYFCCPKGYTPTAVNDPVTGLTTDVICKKDK